MTIIFDTTFLNHKEIEAAAKDFAQTLDFPMCFTIGSTPFIDISPSKTVSINRLNWLPVGELDAALRLIAVVAERHNLIGWKNESQG